MSDPNQPLQKKETKYNEITDEQIKEQEKKANQSTTKEAAPVENTAEPEKKEINNEAQVEGGAASTSEQNNQSANNGGQKTDRSQNQQGVEESGSQANKSQNNEQVKNEQNSSNAGNKSGIKQKGSSSNLEVQPSNRNKQGGEDQMNRSSHNGSKMMKFSKSMAFEAYRPDPSGNEQVQEFYDAQKQRINSEKNAELLGNRISLLRQEELNLLKKIEETRKKALEIYYLKLKKEATTSKKQQEMQRVREENERKEQLAREQYQQKINNKKSKVSNDPFEKRQFSEYELRKKNEAMLIKQQSEKIKRTIEKHKEIQMSNILAKKEVLKVTQSAGREKIFNFYMQKRQKYRSQIVGQKELERKKVEIKEAEIKEMQKYENQLIDRLQHTQVISKSAFDELQSALLLSAKDFADKFLKNDELPPNEEEQPQNNSNSNSNLHETERKQKKKQEGTQQSM